MPDGEYGILRATDRLNAARDTPQGSQEQRQGIRRPRHALCSLARTVMRLFCILCALLCPTSHAGSICGCEHRYDLLMAFYNETNGPRWTNRGGWGTLTPCNTNWYGLTCDATGDITEIDINTNNLTGALPASWSSLSSLQYLSLSGNGLSGTLPPSWSNMTNLQFAYLYSNRLNGTLPASWSSLSSLLELSLNENSFSGTLPPSWSNMTNLQTLNLDNNRIDGALPAAWSNMSSLQRMVLDGNLISGTLPPSWSAMTNLQNLYLSHNTFNGTLPAAWSNMSNLLLLQLDSNRLSGTLPNAWSNLQHVRSIDVSRNSLSGTLPASWSRMPSLQTCRFFNNGFSGTLPDAWSNMSSLNFIDFGNNMLNGSLPPSWSRLTNVRNLYVYSNTLNGALPPSYSSMSNMLEIHIYNNSFTGTLPASWSNMSNMWRIMLASNRLSGTLPTLWSNMASMQSMILSNNLLSGTLPPSWSGMVSLNQLLLNQNCLVGSVPNSYASLSLLLEMNLCNTNVTGGYHLTACSGDGSHRWPLSCSSGGVPIQTASQTQQGITATVIPLLAQPTTAVALTQEAAVGAVIVYGALVAGGSVASRGAVPALQRASAVLRLVASYCQTAGKVVQEGNDRPFSALADNPLALALPVSPAHLEHAAGAAVGNTLLVAAVGLASHAAGSLQQRVAASPPTGGVRWLLHAVASVLPSFLLPGALAVAYGTLLQPSVGACVALMVGAGGSVAPILCGVCMLGLWVALPLYYAWAILWRGHRSKTVRGGFLLTATAVRADGGGQRALPRRRRAGELGFAIVSRAATYLSAASMEWTVHRGIRHGAERQLARLMLEKLDAVFGAYVGRREWFFLLEWGVCALHGVLVLGVAETLAMGADDDDAACTAAQWGAWCALACGAVEIALCMWLRPFSVRLELCVVVTIGVLGVLAQSLALGGEMSAAADVVLSASVLELVAIVVVMLLDGAAKLSRTAKNGAPPNCGDVLPRQVLERNTQPSKSMHRPLQSVVVASEGAVAVVDCVPPRSTVDRHQQLRRLVELVCQASASRGQRSLETLHNPSATIPLLERRN